MKDSRVAWLGRVPKRWTVAQVKRFFDVRLGKMLQPQAVGADDAAVPYLKAKNVQWFEVDTADLDTMYANPGEIARYRVETGDLLVCEGGEGGRCGVVTSAQLGDACPYIIQNALHRIRPRLSNQVGQRKAKNSYLQYVLRAVSLAGWFDALNDKATIAHLTAEKLAALLIPMPDILEQGRISRYLDSALGRIDRYIRAKEKLISLLEQQQRAFVEQAVTGRIDVRTGERFSAYKASGFDWLGEMPRHWRMVRNGRVFAQRNETGHPELPILEVSLKSGVRLREFGNSARKQVMSDRSLYKRAAEGDVTYNMMRMWQGAVGVAPTDGLVSPAYVVAQPMSGTDSRYFDYLYRTRSYMTEVDKYSRGIVKDRNRLYWEDFKQMPTPCPPSDEQATIAVAIDRQTAATNACIGNMRSQISLAHEYRTRLVADVVTGKLDVRDLAAHLPKEPDDPGTLCCDHSLADAEENRHNPSGN